MRRYWEEAYDMNASNNKQAFAEGDTANARRRTTKLVPVACAARPEDHPTRPQRRPEQSFFLESQPAGEAGCCDMSQAVTSWQTDLIERYVSGLPLQEGAE